MFDCTSIVLLKDKALVILCEREHNMCERERELCTIAVTCASESTREGGRQRERERTIRGTYCNGGGALSLTILLFYFSF